MKEYINRKKIAHAIELLEQCDLTVEQISDHLNTHLCACSDMYSSNTRV